jgi:hypothetical protein
MEDGRKKNMKNSCLVEMCLSRITALWEELEENIGPCRNKKWCPNSISCTKILHKNKKGTIK